MVQIAHTCVDQSFKGSESNALKYARPKERRVMRARSAAPDAREDDDDGAENVEVAFAPDACAGNEEEACEPNA
jgi:hypothetical protein